LGRKTRQPSIENADKQVDPSYGQTGFSSGVIRDEADTELPADALADGFNLVVYPKHAEGRTGSVLFTDRLPPRIAGTGTFTASKSAFTVTSTTEVFTRAHVGSYVVFPGTPQQHFEIVQYLNATSVVVDSTGTIDSLGGCFLRGKHNLFSFHEMSRQWLMQFYKQLYLRDYPMDTETQVLTISRNEPSNAIGSYAQLDRDYAFLFNSNGIFKTAVREELPKAFQINIQTPDVRIADIEQTDDLPNQYNFLYGCARLSGSAPLRSRLDPLTIETETPPVAYDLVTRQDYADIWTSAPIGPQNTTYGQMRCGPLDNAYVDASGWAAIAPNFGTFIATINGIGPLEVGVELSYVRTLAEAAARIQASMQDFWPHATCDFIPNASEGVGHLLITGGRVAGGTVTYLEAGTSGTDISAAMQGRDIDSPKITTPYINEIKVLGPLWVPKVPNTVPVEYEWHLTHFPIWRTRELNHQYQQDMKAKAFNDPNRFIWEHDLRICAALYVCRRDGVVTALSGKFEPQDEGSTLLYANGERDEIGEYIDEYTIRLSQDYYYGGSDLCPIAAAIGNGRVMEASQTDDMVTTTDGDTFTEADLRKTIHWSNGRRSYIREYIDANNVRVYDTIDKEVMAITMDPKYRMYASQTTDATLRSRQTTLLLRNRFWQPIRNSNVGIVAPGFMIAVRRGESDIHYGQLPDGYEYLGGFHNKGFQINTTCTDDIVALVLAENRFVILCGNRTWFGPTNISEMITVPTAGEVVAVLGGVDILDGNIGCHDWGSIQQVGTGEYQMITSEPGGRGLRKFNGFSFGPNQVMDEPTGIKKFVKDLRRLQQATASLYDGLWGYVWFGKE